VIDQAALVVDAGAVPRPEPQPSTPVTQEQPKPEPQPEQVPVVAPQPAEVSQPVEQAAPIDIPEIVPTPESETVVPEPIAEENPKPDPIKPAEVVTPEAADPVVEAQPVKPSEPKDETPRVEPDKPKEQSKPTEPGTPGELSEKESIALATDIIYDRMHRPIVSQGLELITKAPRYPWSVRNAANPKNAIVIIRFGRDGKVKYADFLTSKDRKRRHDTGYVEVDSPLLAAIYQWRAKGKRLLELDPNAPNDPKNTIEISMRILFTPERKKKADDD
ncbi:MAG: hypothetical protein JKY96_01265, partial [Phycisphaerales bacterium]|nr:hypothetical protein [Phycisphaerales bacterium]